MIPESSTFETISSLIAKEFGVAPGPIDPQTRLDALAMDSLAMIDFMFRLEDHFKVTFPQDASEWTEQIQTIGDLVGCIDTLVKPPTAVAAGEGAAR